MSLTRFVEKWTHADYPPEKVSASSLSEAEKQLGFEFPSDYKHDLIEVGLPRPTIALLDAIVERELDIACLGDFYSPHEIVTETSNWREIGMPGHLIAIAGDESGNKFCFSALQLGADRRGVWYFDHDFGTVKEIAPSFSAWIDVLSDIEPWVGE